MSDTPKRRAEENDAIRQILDRLRRSVDTVPSEEKAPAPEEEKVELILDTEEEDEEIGEIFSIIADEEEEDPTPDDGQADATLLSEFFVLAEEEDTPVEESEEEPEETPEETIEETVDEPVEQTQEEVVEEVVEEIAEEVVEEVVEETPAPAIEEVIETVEAVTEETAEETVEETVEEIVEETAEEAVEVETIEETPEAIEETPETIEETPEETPEEKPYYPNAFDGEDFSLDEETPAVAESAEDENSQFFTLAEEEEESGFALPAEEIASVVFEAAPITPETMEEDEVSSVSTDDFLSALAWEGENDTPIATEEIPVSDATAATPVEPEKPAEEKAPAPASADPARSPLSFFAPTAPTKKEVPACAEEAMNTQITDEEATDLFAPKRPASFGSMRARYLASEEGSEPLPQLELPPFATEENGYAVEVSVGVTSAAETASAAPAAPIESTVEEKTTEVPQASVETIDDSDFADDGDDAFLNLIGKLTPHADEKTKKPAKPQTPTEKSPFGSPVSGEQLAMEIFTMEPALAEEPAPAVEEKPTVEEKPSACKTPAREPEKAPDIPAHSTAPAAPFVAQATAPDAEEGSAIPASNPFFGEMPTRPVREDVTPSLREEQDFNPTPASSVELIDDEATEMELPPDETDEARRIPLSELPQEKEKKAKREKKDAPAFRARLSAFFGRLAPAAGESDAMSGLYTEEAAAYNEYSSRNQIAVYARKFVSEGSLCTLRIVLLAFLCTFLFALENFSLLGYHPAGPLAAREMQLALHLFSVLLCAIASIPVFSRVWHQLFARRVTAELYPTAMLVLAVIYDALLFFLAPASFAFFGLIPAVAALLIAIADGRKVKADFAAFRLLSSSGDKLACTVSAGGKTEAERNAVSDLPEGDASRIVSMKKVGFATGFFHRIVRNCEDSYRNTLLLCAGAVVSLGVALACGIVASSFLVAFHAFLLTLSLLLPAALPLIHKVPTAMLSLFAAANNCAVVGEVSALEYSDAAAMTFEDVEAFPAKNMRIQRIKLYNDSALDRVLYQVSSLFSTVGGPLDGVFRASTAELGISEECTLLSVDRGGLCALVDGREIRVGSGEYMLDNAVHVFYDPEDERLLAGGKISVMFAAEDGQLVAKFYVRYKMDGAFEKSVEALARRGVRTLIRTYDPNLSEELINNISYAADFSPRIVKKEPSQQKDLALPQINSGLVTKSSSPDLLRTLFACRRTVRLVRAGGIAAYALFGLGLVGSILLAALSVLGALPSAYFAGYQLVVALLYLLVSKITV